MMPKGVKGFQEGHKSYTKITPPIKRFFEHVRACESNACWWFDAKWQAGGYGKFRAESGKPGVYAHRFIWEHENGKVPEGMKVLHTCDNPLCVNPSHLFLGTMRDNVLDSIAKRRFDLNGKPGYIKCL
jgi:HNH endonuclease